MCAFAVSEADLRRLHRRFKKLDKNHSGTLELDELLSLPGLQNNPLVKRVVDVFDVNQSGSIDFHEFILALSIFCKPGAKMEKLGFLFRVYDIKGRGFISNGDLFHILKVMVGDNLEDVALQQLVDRTIARGDHDLDGVLSFEEFRYLVDGQDIEAKLQLSLHSSSSSSQPGGP